MSGETPNRNVEDAAPVPDYELDQYFPKRADIDEEDRRQLRKRHGYFRAYFAARPDEFRRVQRWLNQARKGVTYDSYLARSAKYAMMVAALGLLVGVLLTAQLARMGVFSGFALPVDGGGPVAVFVETSTVLVAGVLISLVLAGVFGTTVWLARYYYPLLEVNSREQNINVTLPHAIVYMYALSYGGMNTVEVIREMAQAEDVYGEVSKEFDMILRDVELFGNDLFTALRDARNITPSDNMEQFLDDMLSVLDSGSDFSQFLENEAENYMEEARREQTNFLETLSVLSEVFVVAFVAAPLFLIVTLLVISLLGGEALLQTYLLIYVGLPLGMAAFLITIDVLSAPFAQHSGELDIEEDDDDDEEPSEAVRQDQQFDAYERRKRRDRIQEMLRNPVQRIRQRTPLLSLVLTVPVALFVVGFLAVTGIVDPTPAGFGTEPIMTTVWVAVVPFFVVAGPLTAFYELEHRREQRIAQRFPDTLNILSSANQMGIRLTESLALVSRWSEGALSEELRKVRNDITWNHDVESALLSFANRLKVPQVTRTMKLIAKGSHSSSDLGEIISIAAEDTRNRYQIERRRRDEMNAYVAIVIIGFLVYLGVIVLLDTSYLTPIADISTEVSPQEQFGSSALVDVTAVPVEAYRMVFFHSALIQGVGTGLLAGKLANNEALSGLKYSVLLVALALAVFLLI